MSENNIEAQVWLDKAKLCTDGSSHNWIPISKQKTNTSEHVTIMICGNCFKVINLEDIHKANQSLMKA